MNDDNFDDLTPEQRREYRERFLSWSKNTQELLRDDPEIRKLFRNDDEPEQPEKHGGCAAVLLIAVVSLVSFGLIMSQ